MTHQEQAEHIMERFKKYGVYPGDKFLTLFDAFIGMLDAVDKKVDRLEQFAKDMAEDDCAYGDNCPTFGTRHGQCDGCKARETLKEAGL